MFVHRDANAHRKMFNLRLWKRAILGMLMVTRQMQICIIKGCMESSNS